ncbi:MAG: hypothetical protein IKU57_04260, partial [Oscillospiraceae bacterium]|nr:hypothetical protein [Oscillospiraceae bacterium]
MKFRRYAATVALCLVLVLACMSQFLTQADAAATTLTLSGNETARTITQDTVLDLNGYNITTLTITGGAKVTVKDSQTDDFNAENGRKYGKITTVTGGTVTAENGYLLVSVGGYSAHKLTLQVSGVSLRAAELEETGVSMYYQCTFGGDQVVKDNIVAYGVAMGAGKAPDFREKTFTRDDTLEDWTTGAAFTGNSTLLKGIMRTG